ncbi:hypothetical protein [Sphingobacterium yanglingense]|uniref:YD repeat-containing protein n=1 Tax=Sphingobacterium yanglingense TaxID=1437280 RepID=A0A4R6WS58_9SPHI|nr:hypothetical protein [Sphingobacterium yanglingense]TDQ82838.1 hypothetical protein CLV99_0060 [Sphingobacterium yanglingense]
MKTMINKTIWLLFIAVALVSCSKDDDCDPEDENSPCYAGVGSGDRLLLTEEKTNGKTEMRFEYNAKNQVVVRHIYGIDGTVVTENFTYNGNKMIKIERKSGGQSTMTEEYTYGSGDKPTSGVLKNGKNETIATMTYNYSGRNVTETSFDTEGNQVNISTYTSDEKGNPIKWETVGAYNSFTMTHILGDYDDKPYRYTSYPWAWKLSSVNNARSYSLTTSGVGGGTTTNDNWVFSYNTAGYPVKAEVYDKNTKVLKETRVFTYKKAS